MVFDFLICRVIESTSADKTQNLILHSRSGFGENFGFGFFPRYVRDSQPAQKADGFNILLSRPQLNIFWRMRSVIRKFGFAAPVPEIMEKNNESIGE